MAFAYPIEITQMETGVRAAAPDVRGCVAVAEDREDAMEGARQALGRALAWYVRKDLPLPEASPAAGRLSIEPTATGAAKLHLYCAMRRAGLNRAELAQRLGLSRTVASRLLSHDHASRIENLEHALATLGVRLSLAARPLPQPRD